MLESVDPTLSREVRRLSDQQTERCNQCGKCTAGCPMSLDMDLQPNQIMRAVQLGAADRVLRSRAIWLCASCEMCASRCPMELSVAEVTDALRQMALERGVADTSTGVPQFHRGLLESVARHGRAHEIETVGAFKMRTFRLTEDIPLGIRMFTKGQLPLLPPRPPGRGRIAGSLRSQLRRKGAADG